MEERRELPVGWAHAEIGELCDLKNGRAFKAQDWKEEGLPIVRIQNLNKRGAPYNYFQGEVEERFRLRGGELLFAWSGTPGTSFGAHIWKGADAVLNQHIFRVDFDRQLIDIDFFRHAINQKLGDLIDTAHGGVGLRHVTKGKFEKTEVCLPPQAEQRRIAAKLDATLAAVDACRQRLDGVEALLKRFRQSVLAAATSGELTREWREGKEIAFDRLAIQDLCLNERYSLCIGPFGSNLKVSDYEEQGVPLVFVREIRARKFGGPGTKYVTPEKAHELIAHQVRPGDLLMTKMGDPPGDTAIYPENLPFAIMTSDVVCIRPDPSKIDKTFLSYLLESPGGRDLIQGITAGVAQQKISLERLKTVFLMVPSLPEQQEIVRRTQELFSLADQLEARLTSARRIVERLTPALLAKAFRGELVPQDPSDEPATALLERLAAKKWAARQAESAAGKPSRRGRRKAAATPEPSLFDAAPVAPDGLATLLRECGSLSEKALLAASELEPTRFAAQLELEHQAGRIRRIWEDGEELWEACPR